MSVDAGSELELLATRWIPSPPEKVWVACTTKRGLERWWSPEDLHTTVRRIDVRPEGAITFHVTYAPALLSPTTTEAFTAARIPIAFDLRGKFSDVVEHRRLTFDLTLDIGKAGAGIPMSTRLELEPEGTGTRATLVGRGAGTPHWAMLGRQNLAAQLERLERAASSDP